MTFQIVIDAHLQASPSLMLDASAQPLDRTAPNSRSLEVGAHLLYRDIHGFAVLTFQVTEQGLVDYDADIDISAGGCCSGRGTATLGLVGHPVTVDATELEATTWYIESVTTWRPGKTSLALDLLPTTYHFVPGNGPAPEAAFEVRADGSIEYAATSDAFLAGRGTMTFRVLGLRVTLDATRLSALAHAVYLTTGWLPNSSAHTLNLLPADYRFQQGNGLVPEAAFTVRIDGTVDYANSSDSFLRGRGTTTLEFLGLPVTLDATLLTVSNYALQNITGWLANTAPNLLNLLPGAYAYYQGNGLVPGADFTLKADGTIDYATGSDGFLSGRDTSAMTFSGFALALDARALSNPSFTIVGLGGWFSTQASQAMHLLPGAYQLNLGDGVVPSADFQISADGVVDYAPISDTFLAGRGTSTYQLLGVPVTIDAHELTATEFRLANMTDWLAGSALATLQLMPSNYRFVQQIGLVPSADFDVRTDGTIDYPASADGYVSGRGTNRYALHGWAITIDCTALAVQGFHIPGLTDRLSSAQPQPFRLLPASYAFL